MQAPPLPPSLILKGIIYYFGVAPPHINEGNSHFYMLLEYKGINNVK
jgi:hypothetical protein